MAPSGKPSKLLTWVAKHKLFLKKKKKRGFPLSVLPQSPLDRPLDLPVLRRMPENIDLASDSEMSMAPTEVPEVEIELPPWPLVITPGEKHFLGEKAMEVGHQVIVRPAGGGPITFPWPWGPPDTQSPE